MTWGSITPLYKEEKKGEYGTGETASGDFVLEFAREPGGSLPHFMDENTEAQTACPRSCGQLTAELLFCGRVQKRAGPLGFCPDLHAQV